MPFQPSYSKINPTKNLPPSPEARYRLVTGGLMTKKPPVPHSSGYLGGSLSGQWRSVSLAPEGAYDEDRDRGRHPMPEAGPEGETRQYPAAVATEVLEDGGDATPNQQCR